MRAKLVVRSIHNTFNGDGSKYGEELKLAAVCKKEGYTGVGEDENNTYARYTPSADLRIYIANPDLFGKFTVGQEFYVDFTEVVKPAPAAA